MLHNRLAQLREERANGEGGFTLIELLVVVVIIGILIAIAIPLYLNYKKGAADKAAQSDVRNAVATLEQCNTDNNGAYPTSVTFPTTGNTNQATLAGCSSQFINKSANTTLTYYPNSTTTPVTYIVYASNSGGSADGTATGGYYCYSSKTGGSVVKKTGAATPAVYADAC